MVEKVCCINLIELCHYRVRRQFVGQFATYQVCRYSFLNDAAPWPYQLGFVIVLTNYDASIILLLRTVQSVQ